jgi:hypothetical protein
MTQRPLSVLVLLHSLSSALLVTVTLVERSWENRVRSRVTVVTPFKFRSTVVKLSKGPDYGDSAC